MNSNAFTWLTKQSVRHKDGFVVESAGRFAMAYIENGKKMIIDVENGRSPSGQFCVYVGPGSFLQWDGESVLIPSIEQERIERNFKAGLHFMDIEMVKFDPNEQGRG